MEEIVKYRIVSRSYGTSLYESETLEVLVSMIQKSPNPDRYLIERYVVDPEWKNL